MLGRVGVLAADVGGRARVVPDDHGGQAGSVPGRGQRAPPGSRRSAKMMSRSALPSRSVAVTGSSFHARSPDRGSRRDGGPRTGRRHPFGVAASVEEVPGSGEVHGRAGAAGGGDGLGVADRPARLDDGADPGVQQRSADRRRTGRTRPMRRRRRRRGPPARSTASRAESTRLTCPMPIPTLASPWASRIALDFTARQARQAKDRSASTSGGAGSPGRQRPVAPDRRPARRWCRPTAPAGRR